MHFSTTPCPAYFSPFALEQNFSLVCTGVRALNYLNCFRSIVLGIDLLDLHPSSSFFNWVSAF